MGAVVGMQSGSVVPINGAVPSNGNSSGPMLSRGGIIKNGTKSIIEQEKGTNGLLDYDILYDSDKAERLRGLILDEVRTQISVANTFASKGEKYKQVEDLDHEQVAEIIKATGETKVVRMADGSRVLSMRYRYGKNIGISALINPGKSGEDTDERVYIEAVIRRLAPGSKQTFISEVIDTLSGICDTVEEDRDSEIIYCSNGVYDARKNKPNQLIPLSEPFIEYTDPLFDELYGDRIRFFKLGVSFNPNAKNKVVIHNEDDGLDWDIDSAIYDVFDVEDYTEEEKQILTAGIWQVFQFGIRGINGKKAVWWSDDSDSTDGGSGKSTLATILINLVGGIDRICAVPIESIAKEFELSRLPQSAIMVADESDADTVAVEKIAAYKSLITNGSVMISEKYRRSYPYKYGRLILQLFNNTPKIRSKGGALWSRILNFKFKKNYRTEKERTYIADDYVNRTDVLEYVLYKLLHMDMVETYKPGLIEICNRNKNDIRKQSSRVWAMMDDIMDMIMEWKGRFDIRYPMGAPSRVQGEQSRGFELPIDLLYDLYREWSVRDDGRDRPMTKPQFTVELSGWVAMDKHWVLTGTDYKRGCGHLPEHKNDINTGEPKAFVLFDRYSLERWSSVLPVDHRTGGQPELIKVFKPASGSYRGWFRWVG